MIRVDDRGGPDPLGASAGMAKRAMTPVGAAARLAFSLVPAAVAAVIRAPVGLVAILGMVGLFGLTLSLLDDWSRRGLLGRGSGFVLAARPRTPPPPGTPRDLDRLRTLVAGRIPSAVGVHQWLRPLMADIAASRLGRSHGIDLTDPAAAVLVPEPLWDLVRPDRPEPADRNGPGLTQGELSVLVDQLGSL